MAKTGFENTKKILTNQKLPRAVRKRVLGCYVELILLYARETWTMNKGY